MSDQPPISGKVGLDVTDFKTGISEMNRDIRVIESAFKATAAGLGDWASSATGLEERIRTLTSEIEIQQRKVGALRGEYERVAAEQGINSRAAEELEIKLNREREALGKMQTELKQDKDKLEDLQESSEDAGRGMEVLERKTDGSRNSLEKLKSIAGGLGTIVKIGAGAMLGMAAAVGALGVGITKLVTDSADMAGELVDLSLKTGISTTRLQELAYAGDQLGTSTETITSSLARMIRSMGMAKDEAENFQDKTSLAAEAAAEKAKEIQDEYTASIEEQQGKLEDLSGQNAKRRIALEIALGESILEIANSTAEEIETLEDRHTSKMASIRNSISGVEEDYEYNRIKKKEDTEREISRMDEDYSHDREEMVQELAAAESDAEKARVQARIDEQDYEYNTRRKRRLEDAEVAQKEAEHAKDERIKALQDQLNAETKEYEKQQVEIQKKQDKQEQAARARYQNELTAAKERYDGEVEAATAALEEIKAKSAEAAAEIEKEAKGINMGMASEAFEKLGVKVTDANGNLRDSEEVFADVLTALGNIENETERDAIAMQIFGRSAMELNPLMKAGADELARLSEKAHEVGAVMSEETVSGLEEFGDKLEGLKAGLKGTLGALAGAFLPGFQGLADTAQTYLGQFSEIVRGADGDLVKMAAGVGDLVGKIAKDIATRGPEFLQAGLNIIQGIINAITENLPQMVESATGIITTLMQFLADNLPLLIKSGIQIVLALVTAIIDNLPALVEAGMEALISLIEGIAEALPELVPTITEAVLLIVEILLDNLPMLIEAGGKLLLALVEGLAEALPILLEKAPELVQALADAVIALMPILAEIGLEMLKTVTKAIVDNLPLMGETVGKLMVVIDESIKRGFKQLIEVGKQIVNGIWQGIKDNKDEFLKNIVGFFDNMVQAVHDALLMHSPSGVFAAIGENAGGSYVDSLGDALERGRRSLQMAFGETALNLNAQMAVAPAQAATAPTGPATVNQFYLTANYKNQPQNSLAADIRLLQMLYGS